MPYPIAVAGSRQRFFIILIANFTGAALLIVFLTMSYSNLFPRYLAKAQLAEALIHFQNVQQDLTLYYQEHGEWPERYHSGSPEDKLPSSIAHAEFDGQGGYHITFSDKDPVLNGKTLSVIASRIPQTIASNILWQCGYTNQLGLWKLTSDNRTNVAKTVLPPSCLPANFQKSKNTTN